MLPVTDVSKWQELKASYERIFLGTSPSEPMYQCHIAEKLIVFPIEGMHLTEEQYHALVQAAAFTDDTEFYVSEIEMPDGFDRRYDPERATHWKSSAACPYQAYRDTTIVLENAIYSRSGRWGVILSAEDHAVVGGSSEFMAAFRRFYPRWPLDMDAFASCWSEYARSRNTDVTWLSAYIDYIYK
ncbi:hypothetical protein FOI68_15355 [Brevibacillus sp. LEMMJ03]|uniref:hypothetical protein n=1 Tax=Brevibacillus sp. LEMMJ03 TaxID=2595056 RepID=UPI00117CC130|nr:hypothetical protein [Brevibacillus sp. LEMMJ03]TRY24899.1 hypothetical protein FOI68_15355 [Brevibacillus sp. LEMMJ03]